MSHLAQTRMAGGSDHRPAGRWLAEVDSSPPRHHLNLAREVAVANGQYIRVYHLLRDEYPEVWKDDAQLALFVRLLAAADKWWPERAPISRRSIAYRKLVSRGLVLETEGGLSYTIRGLDKERSRRSEHARYAASRRTAGSPSAETLPNQSKDRTEQSNKEKENLQEKEKPRSFIRWECHEGKPPPSMHGKPLPAGQHLTKDPATGKYVSREGTT